MIRRTLASLTALAAALTLAGSPAHAATAPTPVEVVAFAMPPKPATMPAQALAVPASVSPGTYRVARGDTLSGIAARFCGTARAYPALAAASGIRNPDLIFPGQLVALTCTRTSSASRSTSRAVDTAAPIPATGSAAAVVAFALAQVGKRYVWGAAGPSAYDCSGLVMAAYARVGIRLPHQSESILAYGRPVARGDLRPGDVVWPYHGHVFIYVGNGRIVEAATPRQGVITNNLYSFMTARRLV